MSFPQTSTIDTSALAKLRGEMRAMAEFFALVFEQPAHFSAGSTLASSMGSSMDFLDHRAYAPGDDPRHIDWNALARSGQTVLKLFRNEVRPALDLLVDTSTSMRITPDKERRSLELALLCLESALRQGASVRCFLLDSSGCRPIDSLRLAEEMLSAEMSTSPAALPDHLPLRPRSLRVVVSDLLFPGDPARFARPLLRQAGRIAFLVPCDPGEENPDWFGDVELTDCETSSTEPARIGIKEISAYRTAYTAHFESWRTWCIAHAAGFATITTAGDLRHILPTILPAGIFRPAH